MIVTKLRNRSNTSQVYYCTPKSPKKGSGIKYEYPIPFKYKMKSSLLKDGIFLKQLKA